MDATLKELVRKHYEDFAKSFDDEESQKLWKEQSKVFVDFWNSRIMSDGEELTEDEMIPIIQILDAKGKAERGRERRFEGTAHAVIYQDKWYAIFRGIKSDKKIKGIVDGLLKSRHDEEQIKLLNDLKEQNLHIDALTGNNGNAINSMMFAFNPEMNISMVSLSDRYKFLNFFDINTTEIESLSYGEKMIETRSKIISLKEELGVGISNRGFCSFIYSDIFKPMWKKDEAGEYINVDEEEQSLKKNKQIIFYGPPGTGKTYFTKEFVVKLVEGSYGFHIINDYYEKHRELLENPEIKPGARFYRPLTGLTRPLIAFRVKNKMVLKRQEILDMFSWGAPSAYSQRIRPLTGFGLAKLIGDDDLQIEPDGIKMIQSLIDDRKNLEEIFSNPNSAPFTEKQKSILLNKLSEINGKNINLVTNHILCFLRYCILFGAPVTKTGSIDATVSNEIIKCFGRPRGSDDAPTNVAEWGMQYCIDLSLVELDRENANYKYYKLTERGIRVLRAIERNIIEQGI